MSKSRKYSNAKIATPLEKLVSTKPNGFKTGHIVWNVEELSVVKDTLTSKPIIKEDLKMVNRKETPIKTLVKDAEDIISEPVDVVKVKTVKTSKIKQLTFRKVTLQERISRDKNKKTLVELRNVDVNFGKGSRMTRAIKGMSLNIYRGEVLGLVGESGSGKSTTGNAILGLVDRANGSIKVKGNEVNAKSKKVVGKDRKFLVKNVQMIFQDPASSLNPYKTIEKVIGEGLDNVDIFDLYDKNFDNETISTLLNILETTPTKALGKNKLAHFIELSNNGKQKQVVKTIYNDLKKELETKKTDVASLALNYISLRSNAKSRIRTLNSSKSKLKRKLIVDTMKSVGLTEAALNRYPLEFSGGQQQRVGISRAVILQPELLIADEPISALDVSIQAQVVNIFNDLKEKFGLTFLFIAHDLRMVEYISDRIAVMYKGQLLEVGTAKNIIEHPLHPYTRSLTGSIPSINDINKTLSSEPYDYSKHGYSSTNKPSWYSVDVKENEHYVLGTQAEVAQWIKGDK